jgi:hypothetical protein
MVERGTFSAFAGKLKSGYTKGAVRRKEFDGTKARTRTEL